MKQIHSYLPRIKSNKIDKIEGQYNHLYSFPWYHQLVGWFLQSPILLKSLLVRSDDDNLFPCSLITPVLCELPNESPGNGTQSPQNDWIWSLVNHMSHPELQFFLLADINLFKEAINFFLPVAFLSFFQHSWFLIDWIWLYPFEGFYQFLWSLLCIYNQQT